ncbi:MAG: hypothetical protein ACMXYF_06030 [Candidatus Woesearchaeota archaeon]
MKPLKRVEELGGVKPFLRRYSIDRTTRISATLQPQIEFINKKCPKKVRETVNEKVVVLDVIRKRAKFLKTSRAICFILLYISLFGAIFGNFIILREAVLLATVISGILGTTILILLISVLTRAIDIAVSEAHIIASYIISTAVKYGKVELD